MLGTLDDIAKREENKIKNILVSDVGDGLCMTLNTLREKVIQVDCGTQDGGRIAYETMQRNRNCFDPEMFILSHFHTDHYNGLIHGLNKINANNSFNFKKIYYPRIPKFNDDEKLYYALLTINMRVLGAKTGVMKADFLNIIYRLNNCVKFKYKALSKGDRIGNDYKVLWPPANLKDGLLLRSVKSALSDFNDALKKDKTMQRIYNYVKEKRLFRNDEYNLKRFEDDNLFTNDFNSQEIPQVVEKANKSLRKIANRLSIVFAKDKEFLFLGDLEKHEIRKVISNLKTENEMNYFSIIAPHHGTHWQNTLKDINCFYAIASCGKKLIKNIKFDYKNISEIYLVTQINGNINIPGYHLVKRSLKEIATSSNMGLASCLLS